jgi:hypothetical protein
MIQALWGLSVLATVLAWIVARHRPEHRPIAWLLGYGLATDAVRELIGARVLRPARVELAGAPFAGWTRAAFHVESALFLGWMVGVAAMAVWVFGKRRPWGLLVAWALAVTVLALGYPTVRGELLGKTYLALELAALCTSIGCFISWFAGRERARPHHLIAGFIIIAELSTLAGPFRFGVFDAWDLSRSIFVALYLTLIPTHGFIAWRRAS